MAQILPENGEAVSRELRGLFASFGYNHYKMNKFEEYDLYAHNKDFLVSDSVITFTDGTGKLLALKPDVTLSIVKNTRDEDGVRKLYYDENVYRVAKGGRSFREIRQVGLECIGEEDDFAVYEVLALAKESLARISPAGVLCVSHLGILSSVMDAAGVPEEAKEDVLRFAGEKNRHELFALLRSRGVPDEGAALLDAVLSAEGDVKFVLPRLEALLRGKIAGGVWDRFARVLAAFGGEGLRVDFSVVGDIRYYNGFVFKGYVEGVPTGVLSGGQYDRLLEKMGRRARAVGFAVYLDVLEPLYTRKTDGGADVVLLYGKDDAPDDVGRAAAELRKTGARVLAAREVPPGTAARCYRMEKGTVIPCGENA